MNNEHVTIDTFSLEWWIVTTIVVVLIFLIIYLGKKLKPKDQKILTNLIGGVMIARMIFIHPYELYLNVWSLQTSLPLHLCGLSSVLAGIVIFWRNQIAYECFVVVSILN